jgi:hypothetical protein
MSGNTKLKAQAKLLQVGAGTHYATIQKLILGGLFDKPVSSEEVSRSVSEKSGNRLKTIHVQTYMKKFQNADILHAVKPPKSKQNYWVLTSVNRQSALRLIGKAPGGELFSLKLKKKLQKSFGTEMEELEDNYAAKHGNSTAFLLRKILEKLLIIGFAKKNKESLLEDKTRPGGWKGLQEMIEIAGREKHAGMPFLTGKTATEVKGIKFLGDAAAHNPKISIAITTIAPQLPYIVTAYEELAVLL